MKTIQLILMAGAFLFPFLVSGQRVVALHASGGVTMFSGANPLIDAYNAASSGDTVYLSGGSFSAPQLIDKGLIIYGAGYHPDSTVATNPTLITGVFNLGENADKLTIEGVQFAAGISVGNNLSASNMTFRRCRINNGIAFNGDLVSNPSVNNSFAECVIIGDISFSNTTNSVITNSIIQNRLLNSKSNVLSNSIFLFNSGGGNGVLFYPYNNEFSNNVFLDPSQAYFIYGANDGNIFSSNIFTKNDVSLGSNPISTGNYFNIAVADIFTSHTGVEFSYTSDFHLKNPTAYPGKDGTQAGLYGGLFPFKAGSVPSNPHISSKSIAGTTTPDGKLNIQIRVNAQNH